MQDLRSEFPVQCKQCGLHQSLIQQLMRQVQLLTRERDQVVMEKEELQTSNTRGQEEVQQLRQQVSDSDIIVQWSLSSPSAVSHEHC